MSSSFDERELSRLAHELRGPLAVISGYAELLRTRDDELIRREGPLRIDEAAASLAGAIDDLLIVLALESDALVVDVEPVALEDAVAAAIRTRQEQSAAELQDRPWPAVLADREQLARILRTLIGRARSLARDGEPITIRAAPADRYVRVAIWIGGAELPEHELRTLWARPDGLALYAARRLVELHGGEVSASSEPGGGTTLAFTLPIAVAE